MSISIGSPRGSTEWTAIETLSPSAVTTITTSALPVYDMYKLVLNLSPSATDNINIRLNGDSGATQYYNMGVVSTGVSTGNGSSCVIMTVGANTDKIQGEILIGGKSPAVASGKVGISINVGCGANTNAVMFAGSYKAGNATQISSATIFSSGGVVTITGKIVVYGRNDLH